MGATTFVTVYGNPATMPPQEAFAEARAQARHEYGPNGYTGTIAEKDTLFHVADPDAIDTILDDEKHPVGTKDGPCGYFVDTDLHCFVFFGWASE